METTNNLKTNKLEITIVSLFKMSKLSVGDIFLFSADGFKYVYLGRTHDGLFRYRRCEMRSKRILYSRRNRFVFNMDANGGLYIVKGELFIDYHTALKCATIH